MKKIKYIGAALTLLLCGCGASAENGIESTTEKVWPEYYVEVYNGKDYGSESKFFSSDFVGQMRDEGYTPYRLSYDTERFEFYRIQSDATFYEYRLKDKANGNDVTCTVAYHVEYLKHPSDAFANADLTDQDVVTTVEKDGASYEVYISKKPFVDYEAYNIVYLPFEGYKVSIYADASTPEEALAYIHEFDLVPVEE